MLIKPDKLRSGDKIATVSPSSGIAGDSNIRWRYDQGRKSLEDIFDLQVVSMPNSLKGSDYNYENPQSRAEDLMAAFRDQTIKGIITNIGGDDSIRLLPYIDFDVIRDNPKIFMGFSDITVSHLFCYKAGISSFYGPGILTDFAENVEMDPYTVEMLNRTLFSNEMIGEIRPAKEWTSERLEWDEMNKNQRRTMQPNSGYEVIQGSGIVQGRLIGGCIEALEFIKGTKIWPELTDWENGIIFFETSEEKTKPEYIKRWLRNYAAQGILQMANGIIFGKPQDRIDLNISDLTNEEDYLWLKALIWPGHKERLKNFEEAVRQLRSNPPDLIESDGVALLPKIVKDVSDDTIICIFHTHVANQMAETVKNELIQKINDIGSYRDVFHIYNNIDDKKLHVDSIINGKTKERTVGETDGHGKWFDWKYDFRPL